MTSADPVERTLRERFGLASLRPGQRQVIDALLAGRSAAAVFPTGGGKSLCYQLPALLLEGVTLVVSPLIALMKDQIDALAARGIDARRLDSSLSLDDFRETMDRLRSRSLDLLYVAPERFNNERFRETIQQTRVALFAIDEAHCISEWGHNFRPDYLKLARFARRCRAERRLALTATATPAVLADVCRALEIAEADAVRTGVYRPNLTLRTTPVTVDQRDDLLLARLHERPRGPTIVYVTRQATAVEVADRLAATGLPASPYHAGLETDVRSATQDAFLSSTDGIVVATIAFGMGIDKADIRYIYHYNLPKSLEGLSQEIGRAGRDGAPAICELLACADDLGPLESFAHGDTPDRASIAMLIDALFDDELRDAEARGERVLDVSTYELSGASDIKDIVVRTLMTYLELDGWLEGGTPRYASYKFQPLRTSAEILAEFDAERAAFLRRVLATASKGRTWFTIDAEAAARAAGADRARVVRALDYLGERGWLTIKAEKVRHRYHVLRVPTAADREALIDRLTERAEAREAGELARLAQVTGLIESEGCQVSALGAHFGEPLEQPCGHCTVCLDGAPARLHPRHAPPIDEVIWAHAVRLTSEHETLARPRALARFLCGLNSPALRRAKLTRHALYGLMADVPFSALLSRAEGR